MIFTKCETGSFYHSKCSTKSGEYRIARNGSKFVLCVYTGEVCDSVSKPQTLTLCKSQAEKIDAERMARNVMTEVPQDTVSGATPEDIAEFLNPEATVKAADIKAFAQKCADETANLDHSREFISNNGGGNGTPAKVTPPAPIPAPAAMSSPVSKLGKLVASQPSKVVNLPPHVVIIARAGTGKTTTLIEGLKIMRGITSSITPSEQQRVIFDELAKSRNASSVCFCAFNKSIATELQERVPAGCEAMTLHSMGFKAVQASFRGVRVEGSRVAYLISEILEKDLRDIRKESPLVLDATEKIVNLCKMNLITDITPEALTDLCSHYDIDLSDDKGTSYRTQVFALVPQVIARCLDVTKDNRIDFSDMVWLPVALNLPVRKFDVLLVDEAQDLNRCQQELAKRAGRRLILCGDPKQAIYGFAGADAESIPNMIRDLAAEPNGVNVLPLTVTRRCGKAIVAEARQYVEDFSAHESNGEGIISRGMYPEQERNGEKYQIEWEKSYCATVKAGDMILSRVNAPLVKECFRFLKKGMRANIQGRDVGAGLISVVRKLGKGITSVTDLVVKISDWVNDEVAKEQQKKMPNENKIINIQDKGDCIMVFCEDQTTIEGVITRIESVFTDDRSVPGIRLSSIHKAKGLEAHKVYFLNGKNFPCPHPMAKKAWMQEQELNLCYVAVTRAKEELVYVS